MNRFDNGSISAYTPQSFQELAFVPLMKRQKHNEMSKNLAELSAIATDPLNEHHDEALRLKQDLEGKLGNLSGDLASRGIDSIGKEAFYKLQKERNDLIAPTGRIGQINAAKVAEAKAKEDFMKNADKSFGQNVLEQKWLEHRQKYADMKGRDKDGNIVNIGNLGSPKYVDLDTGIRDVLSTLGSTTTEKLLNSGLQFKNTDHGVVMTNAQGSIVTETNDEQLNNALKALKTRFIDKTGEGRISRDFEGRTTNEDLDYINNRVLGAKVFKQNKDYKTTYDMLNPPSGSGDGENPEDPNYEGVNVEGVNVNTNNDDLSKFNYNKNYKQIITPPRNLSHMTKEQQQEYYDKVKNQNPEKVFNEYLNSSQYLTLAKSIQRTQKINAKSLKDQKIQDAVKKYLTENKDVTIQNKYIDPNSSKVGKLFASKEISKDKKASSELIMERAQQGAYEVRDTKGNLIPADELGKYTFNYSGDMTSKSQIGNIFTNPKQNVGARRGLLYDPDSKKSIQVYVSRGADDFDTPQWKGMNLINNITKITDTKPGLYHKLKVPALEKFGVSNFEVKYNKGSDTYNVSYTDNDGTPVDENPMTDAQFQEYILNTQLH